MNIPYIVFDQLMGEREITKNEMKIMLCIATETVGSGRSLSEITIQDFRRKVKMRDDKIIETAKCLYKKGWIVVYEAQKRTDGQASKIYGLNEIVYGPLGVKRERQTTFKPAFETVK